MAIIITPALVSNSKLQSSVSIISVPALFHRATILKLTDWENITCCRIEPYGTDGRGVKDFHVSEAGLNMTEFQLTCSMFQYICSFWEAPTRTEFQWKNLWFIIKVPLIEQCFLKLSPFYYQKLGIVKTRSKLRNWKTVSGVACVWECTASQTKPHTTLRLL